MTEQQFDRVLLGLIPVVLGFFTAFLALLLVFRTTKSGSHELRSRGIQALVAAMTGGMLMLGAASGQLPWWLVAALFTLTGMLAFPGVRDPSSREDRFLTVALVVLAALSAVSALLLGTK